ncbi:uncharacterized protein BP5553_02821 [Venustampulla echinocandica]|uniref:Ca2+ regulator and membrane fusion protein Fig1-domain-containing protein n=1 Tax=Venustampulla echinocandica TaxID=2656787 RepID=A0A370TSH6_9HELO|nr:uncharacterized protein BP5553_02821 [Venustampulla echinocandica]RDL38481.1 hypothetical protein BP5553_02821 [Venustampulla echinocandica]
MAFKGMSGAKNIAQFVLLLLAVPIILFYILVLAGSSSRSPGIPNIYLVSLQKANETSGPAANLTIHIGYFGMCTTIGSKNLTCVSTFGKSGTHLASSFTHTSDNGAISLFDLASTIQSRIFIFLLVLSGFIFILSFVLILLLERDLRSQDTTAKACTRRRFLKTATQSSVWMSVGLATAMTVGSQQTAAALEFISANGGGDVLIKSGTTLLVLQWFVVGFSAIFAIGSGVASSQRTGPSPDDGTSGPGFMVGDEGKVTF